MLVLNRKESEQILIGNDIVLTVSRVIGNRVRLAIHAPPEVRVLRSDLKPDDAASGQTLPAGGLFAEV